MHLGQGDGGKISSQSPIQEKNPAELEVNKRSNLTVSYHVIIESLICISTLK